MLMPYRTTLGTSVVTYGVHDAVTGEETAEPVAATAGAVTASLRHFTSGDITGPAIVRWYEDAVQVADEYVSADAAILMSADAAARPGATMVPSVVTPAADLSALEAAAEAIQERTDNLPDDPMPASGYTAPDNASAQAAAASAASADEKLTAERLALIDGAAQETAAIANTEAIIEATQAVGIIDLRGPGADTVTLTIRDDEEGDPVPDCEVWVKLKDQASVIAGTLTTDDLGRVTLLLDAGVEYDCYRRKVGMVFTNPQTFTAVAD